VPVSVDMTAYIGLLSEPYHCQHVMIQMCINYAGMRGRNKPLWARSERCAHCGELLPIGEATDLRRTDDEALYGAKVDGR